MHILISNDDGVFAPGLMALHEAVKDLADCQVIAPDRDRSGASSSLTLDQPLYPKSLANGFVGVNGTPTDCVHLGINGYFAQSFDLVISGINLGANLGDDVLYSGTVAAALEGRFLKRPAFAFSLTSRSPEHLPTAAHIARQLIQQQQAFNLPAPSILNVNIPNLPLTEIKGIKLTRLGHRLHAKPPVKFVNPRGKEGYWLSVAGGIEDGGEGTDFAAVQQGYVSVTPILVDRTHFEQLDSLSEWLEALL